MAEFDRYGRLRNPGISSTAPINNITHVQNSRSSSVFAPWDWFNDLIIGIGNFIAGSTEAIIGILAAIIMLGGIIMAIVFLFSVWTQYSFWGALAITIIGGGIGYYVFMIILGVVYWIVAVSLAILRFIFYNAYTLLITIVIVFGITQCNNHKNNVNSQPVRSNIMAPVITHYRCTSKTRLNIRQEPYTTSPIVGKIDRADIVEGLEIRNGFVHVRHRGVDGWASLRYLTSIE